MLAITSAVAVIAGFVAQVGIEIAASVWGGGCFLALVAWLIPNVISDTRGRIRIVPVLLGAIVGISMAGMLSIAVASLDVQEIDHHDHPKLRWSRDTAIFRASVFWGGTLGLGMALWGSWHCTGRRIKNADQRDGELSQPPPTVHD
jgi:hypothetical protein